MAKNYDIPPVNQRFFQLFRRFKLSQAEFGELLGISQRQISAISCGKSLVTPMLYELLRYKLNVNPRWLQEGELPIYLENSDQVVDGVPLLADIPAGDWKYWIDSYVAGGGEEYVCVPDVKGSNLFAIRVEGDSMEPRIHDGDILIVDPHKKFVKDVAVVRHHWGFKVRLAHRHDNIYILTPVNPAYDVEVITPDDDTRIYVPVKRISVQNL
jgi:repressor LexA